MEDAQNNYKCDLEAGENTCQGQNKSSVRYLAKKGAREVI